MESFREILEQHRRRYPQMGAQDAVKLLYQHTYGASHLVTDMNNLRNCLIEERNQFKDYERRLPEDIGNGRSRVYLYGMTDNELMSLAEAFKAGTDGVGRIDKIEAESFMDNYNMIKGIFPSQTSFFSEYERKNYPAVHHSEKYREAYKPAYRVVENNWIPLLSVMAKINEICLDFDGNEGPVIIAIDGRAASGKSTTADMLKHIYRVPVIHMDDFFVPKERKTSERMSEAGGNIDYERFKKEVVDSINANEQIAFSKYDCSTGKMSDKIILPKSNIYIVEGSYSLHPFFNWKPQVSVFMDIDDESQQRRITKRNGKTMLGKFVSIWIPMEDKYFDTFNIRKKCDYVISCSK